MRLSLTTKMQHAYDAIKQYMALNDGQAPTVRVLTEILGLKSTSGTVRLLQGLEKRGWIRRGFNQAQAMELLEPPMMDLSKREVRDFLMDNGWTPPPSTPKCKGFM